MHRADRGWRIGLTKSVRPNRHGEPDPGSRVRLNQEHADALWILHGVRLAGRGQPTGRRCFAAEYGLPTALFHGVGRNLAMDEAQLDRLFAELDTDVAGQGAHGRPRPPPRVPAPPPPAAAAVARP